MKNYHHDIIIYSSSGINILVCNSRGQNFEIVAIACSIVRKAKFTPVVRYKGGFVHVKIAECSKEDIPWGAREFDTIFKYLIKTYDSPYDKTIFVHAHDLSGHYTTNVTTQLQTLLQSKYFENEDYGDVYNMFIKRPINHINNRYSITLYGRDYFSVGLELTRNTSMQKPFYDTIDQCYRNGILETIVTRSSSFFISKKFIRYYTKDDYLKFVHNMHQLGSRHFNSSKYNQILAESIERMVQIILARRCVRKPIPYIPGFGNESISPCC